MQKSKFIYVEPISFVKKPDLYKLKSTVFENHRKSLIQRCERSELRLIIE